MSRTISSTLKPTFVLTAMLRNITADMWASVPASPSATHGRLLGLQDLQDGLAALAGSPSWLPLAAFRLSGGLLVSHLAELLDRSDIVISLCPPAAAEELAHNVAGHRFDGVCLEANAINPDRTTRIVGLRGCVSSPKPSAATSRSR